MCRSAIPRALCVRFSSNWFVLSSDFFVGFLSGYLSMICGIPAKISLDERRSDRPGDHCLFRLGGLWVAQSVACGLEGVVSAPSCQNNKSKSIYSALEILIATLKWDWSTSGVKMIARDLKEEVQLKLGCRIHNAIHRIFNTCTHMPRTWNAV